MTIITTTTTRMLERYRWLHWLQVTVLKTDEGDSAAVHPDIASADDGSSRRCSGCSGSDGSSGSNGPVRCAPNKLS
ncbi:unnamed protein product [Acanthocheilonema viteae]|uniref:Uncharacterized protein n=1 Tax=Acanthocheilonema viteae TaxID=6277 RepID=A0A498ST43_ACAVI|nr:unnamed protein product [Acanthocheilonema viteae]